MLYEPQGRGRTTKYLPFGSQGADRRDPWRTLRYLVIVCSHLGQVDDGFLLSERTATPTLDAEIATESTSRLLAVYRVRTRPALFMPQATQSGAAAEAEAFTRYLHDNPFEVEPHAIIISC